MQRTFLLCLLWLIPNTSILMGATSRATAAEPAIDTVGQHAVASWCVDPFMTAAEEQSILSTLSRPAKVTFQNESLSSAVQWLSEAHPSARLAIDIQSLEEIGLDGDTPVTLMASGTLGQLLAEITEELDLTLGVRGNRLWILSRETAEEKLAIRVYDVTEWRKSRASIASLFDTLMLTVDPDTWEQMGGPSTMAATQLAERTRLTVAAPTVTHLKIQALLDRLATSSIGSSSMPTPRSTTPRIIRSAASALPRFQP